MLFGLKCVSVLFKHEQFFVEGKHIFHSPHIYVCMYVCMYVCTHLVYRTHLSVLVKGIFFFPTTVTRMVRGHIQRPVQCVPEVKKPEREADHLVSSSTEVKMRGAALLFPLASFWLKLM
jgi:hypothetical protein